MSRAPHPDLFPPPVSDLAANADEATQAKNDYLALKLMIVAIVLLSMTGVLSVTLVMIFAPSQAALVNTTILGFLGPSIGAILSYVVYLMQQVKAQNRKMSHELNSRLTQWMKQMEETAGRQRAVGHAEGRTEGQAEEVARVQDQSGISAPVLPIEVVVINPPESPVPTEIVERPDGE